MTVHLVNLTNPMMMKGPVREIISVGPHRVHLRIPPGRKLAEVKLLVAGAPAQYSASAAGVDIQIPSIALHEVVALDLT